MYNGHSPGAVSPNRSGSRLRRVDLPNQGLQVLEFLLHSLGVGIPAGQDLLQSLAELS